eukprot:1581540-Rhodomonas_salina.1
MRAADSGRLEKNANTLFVTWRMPPKQDHDGSVAPRQTESANLLAEVVVACEERGAQAEHLVVEQQERRLLQHLPSPHALSVPTLAGGRTYPPGQPGAVRVRARCCGILVSNSHETRTCQSECTAKVC